VPIGSSAINAAATSDIFREKIVRRKLQPLFKTAPPHPTSNRSTEILLLASKTRYSWHDDEPGVKPLSRDQTRSAMGGNRAVTSVLVLFDVIPDGIEYLSSLRGGDEP